jgi:DNA-binding MarR family transcriptional regulator
MEGLGGDRRRAALGGADRESLVATRQSVQRVADALVRDGLATYEENPNHRRAKLVRITPRGLSVLRAIRARQGAWADALGAEVGAADLRKANSVLTRVLDALTSS